MQNKVFATVILIAFALLVNDGLSLWSDILGNQVYTVQRCEADADAHANGDTTAYSSALATCLNLSGS